MSSLSLLIAGPSFLRSLLNFVTSPVKISLHSEVLVQYSETLSHFRPVHLFGGQPPSVTDRIVLYLCYS
jgi:hypothetical protein